MRRQEKKSMGAVLFEGRGGEGLYFALRDEIRTLFYLFVS